MKQYLLFDSNCAQCTKIAEEIGQELHEMIEIRSLRDAEIQVMLDQAAPGWKWQPTLLIVNDNCKHVYTGIAMRLRLLARLGMWRTLKLMLLISHSDTNVQNINQPTSTERRWFLKQFGLGFFAFTLLPGRSRFFLAHSPSEENVKTNVVGLSEVEGEEYAGFLFLPEDYPIPEYVQKTQGISLCQTGHYKGESAGEALLLNNIDELKSLVTVPFFVPQALPSGIKFLSADLTRYVQTQNLWKASVYFGKEEDDTPLISVHALPDFHRPFPVWPVRLPYAHENGPIYPEKVNISLKPMVLLPSFSGYVFQWIEQDVLYSLVIEHNNNREIALEIAESLVQL